MDSVTQQNAALVEQAAEATRSMSDQAQDLRESMSVFRNEAQSPPAQRSTRLLLAATSAAAAYPRSSTILGGP